MAQKSLGFIELIWTCDSCGTKNPGPIHKCTACGAPQPANVKFERVDPDTFNFIKDEALIRMAKAGPDKHCPFCGTRNNSTAELCGHCGADLTTGATSRPVNATIESTPQQDTTPPAFAPKPANKKAIIPLIIILLVLCLAGIFLLTKLLSKKDVSGTVNRTSWERSIVIEEYRAITQKAWRDQVPAGATLLTCTLEYRYDSDTPKPNSEEVCGTPYTKDTGTGIGEVVQDCHYRVSDDYCSYESMQWTVTDTLRAKGTDQSAYWPNVNISSTQREGQKTESYTVWFTGSGKEYTWNLSDYRLYQQATLGSRWNLVVNGLGAVSQATPAK